MNDPTIASVLDKSIDKLSGGASEVAKAVKQMAPHAWEVAVRQQVAEGISLVVISVAVLFSLCVLAYLMATRGCKWAAAESDDSAGGSWILVAIGSFGLALSLVAAVDHVRDGALKWANPEYYAAMAILQAAK